MKKRVFTVMILMAMVFVVVGCQKSSEINENENIKSEKVDEDYVNPANVEEGVQTITTEFSARSYKPITLQVGVPVKWTIKLGEGDLNGCNNKMIIPKYNIEQKLAVGETIVEFTPTETGKLPYSCWMGMIRSEIVIVDDLMDKGAQVDVKDVEEKNVTMDINTTNENTQTDNNQESGVGGCCSR